VTGPNKKNPAMDQIAIVGFGTTPYTRDGDKSLRRLTLDAAMSAIRDAGLNARDIDGIVGSTSTSDAHTVQSGLGIPEVTWSANLRIPFTAMVIQATNAIYAGVCTTVLAYHATYRTAGTSRMAAKDPLRARSGPGINRPDPNPDLVTAPVGHGAWARRYLDEFGASREHLGYVALNGRSNARRNPHAALRAPLTMEEYLAAEPLREPLSKFDMDYPIDGGDAFVLTTVERAKNLPHPPVLVHAATQGVMAYASVDQIHDLWYTGQDVAMKHLWDRSDASLSDVDLFLPYDGFTIISLKWLEAVGYCGVGEAGPFIEDNWSRAAQRIEINGRIPLNTHGGGLSEGGVQGANHVREAVVQLRGQAGERQVVDASTALVTLGTFFHNAGGMILRSER
jgi:acetyl-CoA acetyltransferase